MTGFSTPSDGPASSIGLVEPECIARVVHDEVMQGLAASALAVDLSDRYCREGRIEEARAELRAVRDGLDLAITALRDLLTDLRLPA